MPTLETRIARLERSCHRWRMFSMALLLGCGTVLALGAKAGGLAGVLRARGLEILGVDGETVILSLSSNDRGDGIIQLHNNRGTIVGELAANERGDGLLVLRGHSGRVAAKAGVNDRGDGLIEAFNNREVSVAYVGVSYRGDGLVDVGDREGHWKTSIGVDAKRQGLIEQYGPTGALVSVTPTPAEDRPATVKRRLGDASSGNEP